MSLSPKQQRFVDEYCVLPHNATQAYRRAGYKVKNDDVAAVCAARLLGTAKVRAAVDARLAELAKKTRMSAEEAWQELGYIANSDIANIPAFATIAAAIDEKTRRAIKGLKIKRYVEKHGDDEVPVELIEFTWWDKIAAVSTILRGHGELKEKVEHTGADGKPIEVKNHGEAEVLKALTDLRDAIAAGADQVSLERGLSDVDPPEPVHPGEAPPV